MGWSRRGGLAALAGAMVACNAFDAELLERNQSGVRAAPAHDGGQGAGGKGPSPGSCAPRAERCNGLDDDCDERIDEDAEADCSFAHAATACVADGTCVIALCDPGYADCNREIEDGCEQALAELACGECNRICAPDGEGVTGRPDAGPEPPLDAGADAGSRPDAATPDAGVDSGPGEPPCEPAAERCNEADDDCDARVDEGGVCALEACIATTPSYRGEACDACTCARCATLVEQCQNHPDPSWAEKCRALVECYVVHDRLGECGDNSDCYMSGSGPCAAEVHIASGGADADDTSQLVWGCAVGPEPAAPCAAAVNYRDQCTLLTCGDECGG